MGSYSHDDTTETYVRTEPFAYSCSFPEYAHEPVIACQHYSCRGRPIFAIPLFVIVHECRKYRVHVRACADGQKDDEEERLEIEESRLCVKN